MPCSTLTIRSVEIRPVSVPLRRPVVSKVGRFEQWTMILIVAEPFALKDGHLIVPNRPGNGLAWNEQAVKRYRYDM